MAKLPPGADAGPVSASCPVGLRGIVPSLHTPFTRDDQLDTDSLRRLVDWTVDSGCSGMLINAVAGETGALSAAEKHRAVVTVMDANAGRVPIIVGVSAASQPERLALAQMARSAGADWMLCQTPDATGGAELVALFEQLAAAGPPQLMIQDLSWDGPGMPLADIVRLFECIPAFQALKIEVVPSGPKYSEVLHATDGRLHVSGGWAIMTMLEAMRRGVHALIPATMEPLYVRVHDLFQHGEADQARALFNQLLPVLAFTHQHLHVSIACSKRLRVKEGLFATALCRPPVEPLDRYQSDEADHWIDHVLGLQKDYGRTRSKA